VEADRHRFGLVVDAICDSQEIVVKPLGHQLKPLDCYAGATIMGDGRIALILDIAGVAQRAGIVESSHPAAAVGETAVRNDNVESGRALLLLFRAGEYARLAVPLARVERLEKIEASAVEYASGRPVAQYRDRILPLLSLGPAIGQGGQETLHVIVFRSGAAELGLVVDEIADAVDAALVDLRASDRHGLLGSAMIAGRVTDLADLDRIAEAASWSVPESLEKLASALSAATGDTHARETVR